jgi:pyruvate dehydrogenase E1 component alpha subunit
MDFFAVYECFKGAIEKARQENRPSFIDAQTYRFRGHSMSDPVHSHYRTKEEVEEMRLRDPIALLVQYIDEREYAGEEDLKAIDAEVKEQMNDVVKQALEAKEPPLESRFEDVYA